MSNTSIKRVILMVLDSCGIGEMPDSALYGDAGSNTLGNTARAVRGLKLPNLEKLGLGRIGSIEGLSSEVKATGSYGKMAEKSAGKDSIVGHWEMMGVISSKPFPVYPQGFPRELIQEFEKKIGKKILGNSPASGTEILSRLGEEHLKTGFPIVYTSGDSVFQVAAHTDVIPLEQLYRMCLSAREMLAGEHAVARVIARPFVGGPGSFTRTADRRDFSIEPPGDTILDQMVKSKRAVAGIGKIEDLFGGRGITLALHTINNADGVDKTIQTIQSQREGLVFTTLVDFDTLWGHRNDPAGFASGLEDFDRHLGRILDSLQEADMLILSADHGCDPTTPSTDHSREHVPLLVYGRRLKPNVDLGCRSTFADIGQTIAEIFGLSGTGAGTSFL